MTHHPTLLLYEIFVFEKIEIVILSLNHIWSQSIPNDIDTLIKKNDHKEAITKCSGIY